jgi:transposase
MKKTYAKVAAGGLDVHYKFSTVTMRDKDAQVVCRERLDHTDREKLRKVLSHWPKDVMMVMEASFGWGWLADLMQEVGLQPVLSNCYKLKQMRKAQGLGKTNKKDADLLSLLPFEKTDWWKVWAAPPEVRDRRERMRYRSSMVEIQTGTKNRICAVFHRHGIFHEFSDLFGAHGRVFLGDLCREGRTGQVVLLEGALAGLQGLVRLLDHVRKEMAWLARGLRGQLKRTELVRRLMGIPGIGLILAHTLVSEIGDLGRFANQGALGSYSLLAPIPRDTGQADPDRSPLGRHLGTHGNRTLKWAFIEAAHGAVKKGGRWRRLFDDYTEGGRKDRNRGYIKVARVLVTVVYAIWKKGTKYTDNPPARPTGSPRTSLEKFFGSTRSGTGQPSQPMAAVQ